MNENGMTGTRHQKAASWYTTVRAMRGAFSRRGLAASILLIAPLGCGSQPQANPDAGKVGVRPPIEYSNEIQAMDLRHQSAEFSLLVTALPADSPAAERELMQQVFTSLSRILSALGTPVRGGVFEHQLSVVLDTRTQLASRASNFSIDPLIDNGIQATSNALHDLAHSSFYQDPSLEPLLQSMRTKITELGETRGGDHSVVAAEAVGLLSQIIDHMTAVLVERIGDVEDGKTPTTLPATAPSQATESTETIPATLPVP